jgi:hypothetical protein
MKSTFIVLIICITTYIILAAPSPKTASHKASIPCYQFYNDHNPETTGCPAITKTQPTTVYFDDFTPPLSTKAQGLEGVVETAHVTFLVPPPLILRKNAGRGFLARVREHIKHRDQIAGQEYGDGQSLTELRIRGPTFVPRLARFREPPAQIAITYIIQSSRLVRANFGLYKTFRNTRYRI